MAGGNLNITAGGGNLYIRLIGVYRVAFGYVTLWYGYIFENLHSFICVLLSYVFYYFLCVLRN